MRKDMRECVMRLRMAFVKEFKRGQNDSVSIRLITKTFLKVIIVSSTFSKKSIITRFHMAESMAPDKIRRSDLSRVVSLQLFSPED